MRVLCGPFTGPRGLLVDSALGMSSTRESTLRAWAQVHSALWLFLRSRWISCLASTVLPFLVRATSGVVIDAAFVLPRYPLDSVW